MGQVNTTLHTNSAKHTVAGGRSAVVAARAGTNVTLTVRDSGVGISPGMLPRVFDLFVQETQTIDRSRGGLGLGLTIVKNLVDLHGGHVSAHSAGLGHGSQFVITVPLDTSVVAAASPTPTNGTGAPHARPAPGGDSPDRILIVDDNEDAAEMLSMVLESRGYATRVAHDGPSALTAAAEFKPHTALLDIGLPVMDGFELARRLRADPGLGGVRLVALTGYGQETDRRRSRVAGFDHHLVKPIDVKSVVEILEAPYRPGA
jgi:CheY-like chemotaxis protein